MALIFRTTQLGEGGEHLRNLEFAVSKRTMRHRSRFSNNTIGLAGRWYDDILRAVAKPLEQFVVSRKGRKVNVLLSVAEYRKLLTDLEELEAIRAYDAAKASRSKAIPFSKAKEELHRHK